jgi:hypothetical protein
LFWATEARGALLPLAATVAALVWANSPWVPGYETLWSTRLSVQLGQAELSKDLRHWVNDGLMTLFFLVVGLEFSRQLKLGELCPWRAMTVPAVAALGGLAVPALLYLAVNPSGATARGWPIVLAGDLGLVLGVLALVGPRCPPQLRVFLLILVLIGDITAVAAIALLQAEVVTILALAVVLELFAVVTVLRLLRMLRTLAYLVVGAASGLRPWPRGSTRRWPGYCWAWSLPPTPRCQPSCSVGSGSVAGSSRTRPRRYGGKPRWMAARPSTRLSGCSDGCIPGPAISWYQYLPWPTPGWCWTATCWPARSVHRSPSASWLGWFWASWSGSSVGRCSRSGSSWDRCRGWSPASSWRPRPPSPASA